MFNSDSRAVLTRWRVSQFRVVFTNPQKSFSKWSSEVCFQETRFFFHWKKCLIFILRASGWWWVMVFGGSRSVVGRFKGRWEFLYIIWRRNRGVGVGFCSDPTLQSAHTALSTLFRYQLDFEIFENYLNPVKHANEAIFKLKKAPLFLKCLTWIFW